MFIVLPRFDRFKFMRFKAGLKETFRHHSLEEYREFFTRGMGGDGGENRVFPWLYTRVFLLCLTIFSFIAFTLWMTGLAISFPTLVLMGSVLITIPFSVLLFELNPKKDLSFAKVVAVFFIGTLFCEIIICFGYFAWVPENSWLSLAWTAFLEEFGKALPAILAILILKKRGNPLACFIIAAAVGAGCSVTEDMGYIFFSSDLTEVLSTSILRAVTSVCTHVVWVGFIGWAFGKFKRPLIDFRFWGTCLFSMALHFGWDISIVETVPWGWILFSLFVCIIVALVVTKIIFKRERAKVLGGPILEVMPVIPAMMPPAMPNPAAMNGEAQMDETAAAAAERDFAFNSAPVTAPEFVPAPEPAPAPAKKFNGIKAAYFHAANVSLAVMLTVLSVLGLAACFARIGYYSTTKTFGTSERFKEYVQSGYEFNCDSKRKFDSTASLNYYEYWEDGKLVTAAQKVLDGDVAYIYNYKFTEEENGTVKEELSYVTVEIDGKTYASSRVPAYYYHDEEEEPSYYLGEVYVINPEVLAFWYDDEYNEYVVNLAEKQFEGTETIISLSVVAGLALIACGTASIVYYVKAGKEND